MPITTQRFATILQILSGVQAVLVLSQAILAGHMLSGNGSMLSIHEAIGTSVITSLALGQFVVAILLWRPGRGPVWPIPTTAALFGLVVLQLGWGFDSRLALHVPVGVTLLGAQVVLVAALSARSLPAAPADHEERP